MTSPQTTAALPLDPRTYQRALECVHCGFCLPACPTYTTNQLEADSPRGRIHFMKAMADGRIGPVDSVIKHLDLCLDCRACETACPSGVSYHELIEETREKIAPQRRRTIIDRIIGSVFFHVFPHPTRLKLAVLPVRLLQRIRLWKPLRALTSHVLPGPLQKMQQMMPDQGALWESVLLERYPAGGPPTRSIGFFSGCVGSVMYQPTNRRAIELLCHLGCDVHVPRAQGCCGAIHHHGARPDDARAMARRNVEAFDTVDTVVTDIAGCGAMLREYDHLLRDDPEWADRAGQFAAKVRDISEVLIELDLPTPPHTVARHVTYHDACHLAHAQGVTDPPRQLLARIPGLKVTPLAESDMCCGAAGTYNLSQPDMARTLGRRKIEHIQRTGCDICVTGNVGCAMQIQSESQRLGTPINVVHPVDLLHEAYFGPGASRSPVD